MSKISLAELADSIAQAVAKRLVVRTYEVFVMDKLRPSETDTLVVRAYDAQDAIIQIKVRSDDNWKVLSIEPAKS